MWIQKCRKKIGTETDSVILKKDTIQVSYDRWSGVVQNKKKTSFRQNPRKDIMQVNAQRKNLRGQTLNTGQNVWEV